MKISELENKEEGIVQFPVTLHISEVDQLAGKLINFIDREMPGLTTGEAVEVLNVAIWWTNLAAFNQFAGRVMVNPEHAENSYWRQVGLEEQPQ